MEERDNKAAMIRQLGYASDAIETLIEEISQCERLDWDSLFGLEGYYNTVLTRVVMSWHVRHLPDSELTSELYCKLSDAIPNFGSFLRVVGLSATPAEIARG